MSLENLKKSIPSTAQPENTAAKAPRARGKSPAQYWGEDTVAAAAEEKLARLRREEPALRPVLRTAARLADLIEDSDVETAKTVITEAMKATTRVYNPLTRSFDLLPDHKTRLAAVTLQLAYSEGTPVRREVSVSTNFESFDVVLERMRQSPEATRILASMGMKLDPPAVIEGEISEPITSDNTYSR
jgi:hypothetical protein